MEKLPQEILDDVFTYLWDSQRPITERFDRVSKKCIRTILSCRLVAHRWFDSETLIRVFVNVLSRTPFVWYNHRLPALEAMSEIPKYTRWFDHTITICGMDLGLVTLGAYDRWGPGREELDKESPVTQYLVHLLRRVSCVEHFRFYPIHPNCLDGTWPDWDVSILDRVSFETCFRGEYGRTKYGYPALQDGECSWWGVQLESGWIFPKIMEAFHEAGIYLDSVDSSLLGNRASYCAISGGGDPAHDDSVVEPDLFKWFPKNLKRIAITITRPPRGPLLNSSCLEKLTNLQHLEITLSKSPEQAIDSDGPFAGSFFGIGGWFSEVWFRLENLKKFRFMADYQFSFRESDILNALDFFPNLEHLALGHILLHPNAGNWSSLLQNLAAFNLKELWLLDPRDLHHHRHYLLHHHHPHVNHQPGHIIEGTHNTDYHMAKYVEDDHLSAAAGHVDMIETETLWADEGYAYPPLRRDVEYPGFVLFEEMEHNH